MPASSIDIAVAAQVACLFEVTACKAGNVHRGQDFADTYFLDFQLSAAAIGPSIGRAPLQPVGVTILEAVRATRQWVNSNTNLGIILLLAPLAAVPTGTSLKEGIGAILRNLTVDDACRAYEAIRLANPGGLGKAAKEDVADAPTQTLREVMALAASRDLVARQYAEDFHAVLEVGVPLLRDSWKAHGWEAAIQVTHLQFLAKYPDSLIARKCGIALAEEAGRRAAEVLAAGFPASDKGKQAFLALDAWLREDGHARNPGTSADLVTASLFAAIREGYFAGQDAQDA